VDDHEKAPRTRYGVGFGAAVSTSPLGEIADRHGTYGRPGQQYEVRLFARTPRRGEWSVALLGDDYHVGGDGYSILHPETDLGFKASFGVVLKLAAIPGRSR
jgi:hypothetical protein